MSGISAPTRSYDFLEELFQALSIATPENRNEVAVQVSAFLNGPIIEHDAPVQFFSQLKKAIKDKKTSANALSAVAYIANEANLSPSVEPYIVELLPEICTKAGVKDKDKDKQGITATAMIAIAKAINPITIKAVLPHFTHSLATTSKWQEKVAVLAAISALVDSAYD